MPASSVWIRAGGLRKQAAGLCVLGLWGGLDERFCRGSSGALCLGFGFSSYGLGVCGLGFGGSGPEWEGLGTRGGGGA